MTVIKQHRHDYGPLPNKSQFDMKTFEKRKAAALDPNNPFCPSSNNEHYLWCCLENVMYHWYTCGCKEPVAICVEDLEYGIWEVGAYAGIPFV